MTERAFSPSYLQAARTGLISHRARSAREILACCSLCPRQCRVNRLDGELGVCRTAEKAAVSSYHPHFGEESPLVGSLGSGTIFFTHCNLLCLFCQNFEISHQAQGREVCSKSLAEMMLALQNQGCHNINFVTPSHVVPQILGALEIAVDRGLSVPLVYNCGGYDRVETLKLLDGIFDIYMPDFKFWSSEIAREACAAPDYPEVARNALLEMHRQVGDLVLDERGVACRGLLIRHLVLPGGRAGTREVARYIAREISPNSYVNIMAQYRPYGRAFELDGLSVPLSAADYERAVRAAVEEGVTRLDDRRRRFFL
ncbi:MAG: radical SAM protein [Deltaproteobacteria bacterium]|nr:radical SAM protein [Deltaproteobacteria bacterium]